MHHRNKNTRKTEKKESQFIRFFIPALLAILIHLSFFGFKKVSPPDVANIAKPKQVILLPLHSAAPDEQRLLAWLKILDSSYVIQPSRQYGFSTTFKPPEIKDIPLKLNEFMSDNEKDSTTFLPVPWQDQHARIRQLWKYEIAGIKALDFRKFKKKIQYPAWLSEQNSLLPQLFEDLTSINEEIRKNPPPYSETVLQVTYLHSNIFPKVIISHSCGSKKLDSMALRTFTVNSGNIYSNTDDISTSSYITVKWFHKEIPALSSSK
jgi:hypothetical protein